MLSASHLELSRWDHPETLDHFYRTATDNGMTVGEVL